MKHEKLEKNDEALNENYHNIKKKEMNKLILATNSILNVETAN